MAGTVDVLEGNPFVVRDERGDIDGSPVEADGLALLLGERHAPTTVIAGRARLEGDPELGSRLLTHLAARASPVG